MSGSEGSIGRGCRCGHRWGAHHRTVPGHVPERNGCATCECRSYQTEGRADFPPIVVTIFGRTLTVVGART